jgi:hypothetical protein
VHGSAAPCASGRQVEPHRGVTAGWIGGQPWASTACATAMAARWMDEGWVGAVAGRAAPPVGQFQRLAAQLSRRMASSAAGEFSLVVQRRRDRLQRQADRRYDGNGPASRAGGDRLSSA